MTAIHNQKGKKEVINYINIRLEEEYEKIVKISLQKSSHTDVFCVNFAKMYYELEVEIKTIFGKYYSYKYFNDYWNDRLSSRNNVVRLSEPIDVEQRTIMPIDWKRLVSQSDYWRFYMKTTYTVERNKARIFIVK